MSSAWDQSVKLSAMSQSLVRTHKSKIDSETLGEDVSENDSNIKGAAAVGLCLNWFSKNRWTR